MTKLAYQIIPFAIDQIATRHLVVHRVSKQIPIALSVYENHLANKFDSPATRERELQQLAKLYTWADHTGLNLDAMFMSGRSLSSGQISSFAHWSKQSTGHAGIGVMPRSARRALNTNLAACSQAESYFVRQFHRSEEKGADHILHLKELIAYQKAGWREQKVKDRASPMAPDLTDEEILQIEAYLDPRRKSAFNENDVRDYLMWRMSIELGLRIGETLAMRLCDCPSLGKNYFQVVRVEDRDDPADPRHPHAPRPKTLTRDLGFIIKQTRFPRLVNDYVSQHRFGWCKSRGRRVKRFLLPHPFLIVSRNGDPLSLKAAAAVATRISKATGIDFHWHLARHAFFNRAYAGVLQVQDAEQQGAKMEDLVLWGGWQSRASLNIYTKRARQERARNVLKIWQTGGDEWTALA